MARLFLLTINYAPEPSGFAPHATALAEHLAQNGHEVNVFTGFPFAPQWRRRPEDQGRLFARERSDRLTVHRLTHFIPRRPSSALQRILMEGSFSAAACLEMAAAIVSFGRPDVVVYIGAQPALAMLARMAAALAGRPYVVRITDLAARAALDVQIVGTRLSKLLDRFEFAAYRKAAGAMVLCHSFEHELVKAGFPHDRISVIANPIDVEQVRPVSHDGAFRERYSIPRDAFVVMHAGSMGLKQGLLTVIAAAAVTRDTRVHWVFVGDGEVRNALVTAAQDNGVAERVHFVPFQPEERMSEMYAAADVLLVNQVRAVKDTLIPGKLLTYMAAGRPVLVAANPASQAARLLRDANGGLLIPPESGQALADAVCQLAAQDALALDAFGARNRKYAEAHFDQRKVLAEQERFLLARIA